MNLGLPEDLGARLNWRFPDEESPETVALHGASIPYSLVPGTTSETQFQEVGLSSGGDSGMSTRVVAALFPAPCRWLPSNVPIGYCQLPDISSLEIGG